MATFVNKLMQRAQLSHSQLDIKHFIYIRSKWLDEEVEFELLLTTNNQCYKSTVKNSEIRTAAEELEQNYDDFYDECKKALTTHMGLAGFDYELDANEQQPIFKLYKCTGFETLYLDMQLRKCPNCYNLLDAAIEIVQQRADGGAGDSTSTVQMQRESLADYEQYVKEAKMQENKLLKKFVLLMNSKKERIEQLEQQLEKQQQKDSDEEMAADTAEDEDYEADTQPMTLSQPRIRAQRILDDTTTAEQEQN